MARFEYTRTVEYYSFNPPSYISEGQFYQMKSQINKHPNLPLVDEESGEKSHSRLLGVLLIGVIALVVSLIVLKSSEEAPIWAIITLLFSVFGVLFPILNGGILESSRNRVQADRARVDYFRNLKNMVAKTNDYREFILEYKKRY